MISEPAIIALIHKTYLNTSKDKPFTKDSKTIGITVKTSDGNVINNQNLFLLITALLFSQKNIPECVS